MESYEDALLDVGYEVVVTDADALREASCA